MTYKESSEFTLQKIESRFADALISAKLDLDEPVVVITKGSLLELAGFLKEDPALRYDFLMDLTAVDYFKRKPRFEVVYHFLALQRRSRLRVKVPVGGAAPEVDSLTSLWASANWYEREAHDMFGIHFKGHPDLRRILMYPEFEGHPLRKDYPIDRRQPRVGPKH